MEKHNTIKRNLRNPGPGRGKEQQRIVNGVKESLVQIPAQKNLYIDVFQKKIDDIESPSIEAVL